MNKMVILFPVLVLVNGCGSFDKIYEENYAIALENKAIALGNGDRRWMSEGHKTTIEAVEEALSHCHGCKIVRINNRNISGKMSVAEIIANEQKRNTRNNYESKPVITYTPPKKRIKQRTYSSCSCSGFTSCYGPRGGRYCITSGGKKRYR